MPYIADTLNYKKLNEIYNLRSCTNEMVVEVTYVTKHDTHISFILWYSKFFQKRHIMCRGCGDDSNVISQSFEVMN